MPSLSAPTQPAPSLADLSWFAGHWETTAEGTMTEEHWMAPAGNLMLGMSRTVAGGKVVSFEFMRLESRDDGIYYVAQVRGRPGVDFRLATVENREAVFVNPGHADHLKKIAYKMNPDGTLAARIEGENNAKPFSENWLYTHSKQK
jgi:hypothetical protein